MKKLMIAVAAVACATVGLADDITSANIVGYQGLATESVGNKMIVPTFLNVGESNKCTLADLKVTGYSAPTWDSKGKKWKGGCEAGQFLATKLTSSGTTDKEYYWIENGTIGPGWFADTLGTAIEGGASSVEFDTGVGLWTQGTGYTLVPAGGVNTFDVSYTTESVGNVAVGNSSPIDIALDEITVTGYSAPTWDSKGKKWKGGCEAGQFLVTMLTPSGTTDKEYYWIDNGTIGPGWFADTLGTAIEGGAHSVTNAAGQGLWTQGTGYKIVFPAPELSK